jgi:hypothetical protein
MSETNEYVGNTGSISAMPSSEIWLSPYQYELERQLFLKISPTKFRGIPSQNLVADSRSQTDSRTDRGKDVISK